MKTVLYVISAFVLLACNPKKVMHSEVNKTTIEVSKTDSNPAQLLLTKKCYTCHNPESDSHDNIIAPPLTAIKKKYKKTYKSKALFVSEFSAFILNPTEEKAIGPTHKFGLMPKIEINKLEAETIANFVYQTALPYPDWLPQHWEEKHEGKF